MEGICIKIAIFGSSGHIAKSLINSFSSDTSKELILFSRSKPSSYTLFPTEKYDVVINCVGIGDPAMVEKAGVQIMFLTEEYDNKILKYLDFYIETKYINLSSGIVHNQFNINTLPIPYYQMAKMNSEVKHRGLPHLNIVDLRVYGFFSRFIDINTNFFMSELMRCVKENTVFITDKNEMIRDYVNPKDFASLIEKCVEPKSLNDAFDIYSLLPISKHEILDYFIKNYGLKVKFVESTNFFSTTKRNVYYSEDRKAEKIGYFPKYTSMETIEEESKCLL